jgi:hypothetical protein
MNIFVTVLLTGIGATAVMDAWSALRRPLLGLAAPDYGLVGRWVGHMARGKFRHQRISAATPVPQERVIGWSVHYLTGIALAAGLVLVRGTEWLAQPTLAPALSFGIATVAAPFLLMQPGMGAGVAASRTPNPTAARVQSLLTHAIFGLGLWAAAWITSQIRAA